jgi:hypothetical protein
LFQETCVGVGRGEPISTLDRACKAAETDAKLAVSRLPVAAIACRDAEGKPMNRMARILLWVLAAGALAILGLGHAWRLGARALWFTEAFTWAHTQFGWAEMVRRLAHDVNPPLYYLLLKLWTAVAGDSETALRAPSLLAYFAAWPAAYLLARDAETLRQQARALPAEVARARDAGLHAVQFVAASPIVYHYAREARMYALGLTLVLWSTWLVLRAVTAEGRAGWRWGSYTAVAAALAYTHVVGLLFVAAQAAFALAHASQIARRSAGTGWRRRFVPPATAFAAILLSYAPWAPTLAVQVSRVKSGFWTASVEQSPPVSHVQWQGVVYKGVLFADARELGPLLAWGLLLAFLGGTALLAVRGGVGGKLAFVSIVLPALALVAVSYWLGHTLVAYRYLLFVFGVALVGAALLVARLPGPEARWLLAALVTGNLAWHSVQYEASLAPHLRPDIRGLIRRLAEQRRDGEPVLATHPKVFFPARYYARDRFAVRQIAALGLLSFYHGSSALRAGDLIALSELETMRAERVWVVAAHFERHVVPLPSTWRLESRETFATSLLEGDVLLELWTTSPEP